MMTAMSHGLKDPPKFPTMTELLYQLVVNHGRTEDLSEQLPEPLSGVVRGCLAALERADPYELDDDERKLIVKVARSNYRNAKHPSGSTPPHLPEHQVKRQKNRNKRKNKWSYDECKSRLYKAIDSFVTQADQKARDICSKIIADSMYQYSDMRELIIESLGGLDGYSIEVKYDLEDRFLHIYSSLNTRNYINWSPKGHGHYIIDIVTGKQLYARPIGHAHGSHNFVDEESQRQVETMLSNTRSQ